MNRVMAAVPEELMIHRGDTYKHTLHLSGTKKQLLPNRSNVWFTIKAHFDDTEIEAMVQVTETGGMIVLGGSSNVNPLWGSITVDEALGTIELKLEANATQLMASYNSHWFYDYQIRDVNNEVTTLSRGRCYITRDATRSI